jgi:hypothetical protein
MTQPAKSPTAAALHRPLLQLALLLLLVKAIEFGIDSQAIFYADSGTFLRNAVGLHFLGHRPFFKIDFLWPTRSFVYGWMIRLFALPFHSFRVIVALQMLLGGLTAWLLAFLLLRFFRVRAWIALAAALLFAVDPVQVVHEHMVMAETATLLATAIYLLAALSYLETPSLRLTLLLPLLVVVLVSLRILYVPVGWMAAVLLPVAAYLQPARGDGAARGQAWRPLLLALVVSCCANFILEWGYKHLTGIVSGREAAYNYEAGGFLLASVSPLLQPQDAPDAALTALIAAQQKSAMPLTMEMRERQLWLPGGLIANVRAYEHEDRRLADQVENRLAWSAIEHHPIGFAELPFLTYVDYWRKLPQMTSLLKIDTGATITDPIDPHTVDVIAAAFDGFRITSVDNVMTPSRTYLIDGRLWLVFLLFTFPLLTGVAWWVGRVNRPGVALLFFWSGAVLFASCMAVGAFYRLLQPFSLPALAGVGIIADRLLADRRFGAHRAALAK